MTRLETICKEPERKDRQENGEVKFLSLSFLYVVCFSKVVMEFMVWSLQKIVSPSNQRTLILDTMLASQMSA